MVIHVFISCSFYWGIPIFLAAFIGVDVKALGIPTEMEIVQEYCRRMNIPMIENWDFYLAFNFFRFAAILQGVYKRAVTGTGIL